MEATCHKRYINHYECIGCNTAWSWGIVDITSDNCPNCGEITELYDYDLLSVPDCETVICFDYKQIYADIYDHLKDEDVRVDRMTRL